jgi:hypothetical protein
LGRDGCGGRRHQHDRDEGNGQVSQHLVSSLLVRCGIEDITLVGNSRS